MRPIHLATVDKTRPVLILTRAGVLPYLRKVTVAPITSQIRGLVSELPVGAANGLNYTSVVALDNIATIETDQLGRLIGYLLPEQEVALTAALAAAFDLHNDHNGTLGR